MCCMWGRYLEAHFKSLVAYSTHYLGLPINHQNVHKSPRNWPHNHFSAKCLQLGDFISRRLRGPIRTAAIVWLGWFCYRPPGTNKQNIQDFYETTRDWSKFTLGMRGYNAEFETMTTEVWCIIDSGRVLFLWAITLECQSMWTSHLNKWSTNNFHHRSDC